MRRYLLLVVARYTVVLPSPISAIRDTRPQRHHYELQWLLIELPAREQRSHG